MEPCGCKHLAPGSFRTGDPVPRVEPIAFLRGCATDMNRIAQRNNLGPLVGSAVEVRPCGNLVAVYSYCGGRVVFDDNASKFTIEWRE